MRKMQTQPWHSLTSPLFYYFDPIFSPFPLYPSGREASFFWIG